MKFLVNIVYFLLMIIYKLTKKVGNEMYVVKYNDEYVFIEDEETINITSFDKEDSLSFDISEPIVGDLTKEALDKFINKVDLKERFVCSKCKKVYKTRELIISGWGCKSCTDL